MKPLDIISQDVHEETFPINLFYHPQAWNGRPGLAGTPGLISRATPGSGEVRGLIEANGYLWGVIGSNVYRWESDWTQTQLATNLNSTTGKVWMVKDTNYIMIVDDADGYVIPVGGTSVSLITDLSGINPTSLAYQDGYFIVTAGNGDFWYISNLNDPYTWDSLDFISAEWLPDDGMAVVSSDRDLFIIGKNSIESYYNSGDPDFPFERLQGAFTERGTYTPDTVVSVADMVLFLADDYTVRQMTEYKPLMISTPALNTTIHNYTTKSDARAFGMEYNGFVFYVLIFPTEGDCWVYNISLQKWHKWAYNTTQVRHRCNCYSRFGDKHIIGDYSNGKIYELSDTTYTDDGTAIRRTKRFPVIFSSRNRIFFRALELEMKTGVGTGVAGDGLDPDIILRFSDNNGRAWSYEYWQSAGAIDVGELGDYGTRVIWRRLGSSRNRIFEVYITDPVEVILLGAWIDAMEGRS